MTSLRDITARVLPDLLSAFALLSRLPLPDHRGSGAASAWAWPLVGAVLGALAAGVASAATWLGVTPGVTAALVLATSALLSGGLHEDGLSDSADGLFGGWTKARRLEIMKDSRIGSYGMLALMLVTMARWSALTALIVFGNHWVALIATGAVSRAPMALMMSQLPNARGEGLSHATGRPSGQVALVGAGIALTIVVLANGLSLIGAEIALSDAALSTGVSALGLAALTLLVMVLVSILALRRIGGQTGDILGATQQLAEAACLAALSAQIH